MLVGGCEVQSPAQLSVAIFKSGSDSPSFSKPTWMTQQQWSGVMTSTAGEPLVGITFSMAAIMLWIMLAL